MEEFPANNLTSRDKAAEPAKEEPKKVAQVTTGKVVIRKKPLGQRFLDTFVRGSAEGAGQYVLLEVIVPAVRDVIADAVSQGVERLIFGETRSASRRTGARPSGTSSYVSYNKYASTTPGWRRDPREPTREPISQRARASHDFREIILATRVEATEVIDRLDDLITRYGQATVSDLYDLVGLEGKFTDEKWGWTRLDGADIVRVREGYVLKLPRPETLD